MLRDLFDLCFPVTCCLCDRPLSGNQRLLCFRCIHDLPLTDPDMVQHQLAIYFNPTSMFRYFFSYLKYHKKGVVQHLLHQIKYKQRRELAEEFGKSLAQQVIKTRIADDIDMIIPVPLHPGKKRKRGYNQAERFGLGLSSVMKIPVDSISLVRKKNNPSQTRRSREERFQNVESIFSVRENTDIRNKHVLLVDDVITTGATLASCSEALIPSGVTAISIATLAMAMHK